MSSRPRLIFTEMPWNIKQDIIDSTDSRTRCVLRKCSRTLRSQVNNSNAFLLPMAFVFSDHNVELKWGNEDGVEIVVNYRSEADGCSVNGKFLFGEDHIERAVADFAAVARHPRTLVDDVLVWDSWKESKLRARQNQRILKIFEKEFASSPLKLQILQFYLRFNQQDEMRVLALTRPGVLKIIGFAPASDMQDTNELISSEHWKRARGVDMIGFQNIPACSLVHFQEWHVDKLLITEQDARAFVQKIFEFGDSFEEGSCNSAHFTPETLNYFSTNFDLQTEGDKQVYLKKMPVMMHKNMEEKLQMMSEAKRTLHEQFFKTLVLQIVTPTVTLFSPIICIIYLPFLDIQVNIPTGVFLSAISLYPAMDAIIIMSIVTDYRKTGRRIAKKALDDVYAWFRFTEEDNVTKNATEHELSSVC